MIALLLVLIAACAYVAFAATAARRRQNYISSELPTPYYSAIQIICGNCSGEGPTPVKTFMDRHGACTVCGGSSYILASQRGAYLRGFVRQDAAVAAGSEARVVAFEARPRPVAPERIAV